MAIVLLLIGVIKGQRKVLFDESYLVGTSSKENMRIVITGGAGFLGSHLCDR